MVRIEKLGAFWGMFGCLEKINCTPEFELLAGRDRDTHGVGKRTRKMGTEGDVDMILESMKCRPGAVEPKVVHGHGLQETEPQTGQIRDICPAVWQMCP